MMNLYSFSIDAFYTYGLSEISTMTLFSIFKNDDDLFAKFNIAYDDKIYSIFQVRPWVDKRVIEEESEQSGESRRERK